MTRRLPGLGALRTFEAAARHLGFSKAAAELGVTPAAVSNQVRALEDQLGARLFFRTSRTVRLTRAGEELLAGTQEALDVVERTIRQITEPDRRATLSVTASPSFAAKWLVPRLDRFCQAYPDIDVRIDASIRLVDFSREEIDVGIRFGDGVYPGLRVDRLFEDAVFPVCSPVLLQGPHPLRRPGDLSHHALLHVAWQAQGETWPDWPMWLKAAGVDTVDATRGMQFGFTSLAIQAAIDGKGVALAKTSLVEDDLASGRLCKAFDLSLKLPPHFAYYVISPKAGADRPFVRAFREWLFAEAAEAGGAPPSSATEFR